MDSHERNKHNRAERKILKAFLLKIIYQLLCDLSQNKIEKEKNNSLLECYAMDSKVMQFLIHSIVESGDYTLEGIAYQTHIPFDVIYDAACGMTNQFSITSWAKIVELYFEVKPEVEDIIVGRIAEIKEKYHTKMTTLLNE